MIEYKTICASKYLHSSFSLSRDKLPFYLDDRIMNNFMIIFPFFNTVSSTDYYNYIYVF